MKRYAMRTKYKSHLVLTQSRACILCSVERVLSITIIATQLQNLLLPPHCLFHSQEVPWPLQAHWTYQLSFSSTWALCLSLNLSLSLFFSPSLQLCSAIFFKCILFLSKSKPVLFLHSAFSSSSIMMHRIDQSTSKLFSRTKWCTWAIFIAYFCFFRHKTGIFKTKQNTELFQTK